MNSLLQRAYDSLPVTVQNAALSAFSWRLDRQRYGKEFRHYQRFLRDSQWWDSEKLLEWQSSNLRRIVRLAYEHVPYYRRRFDEHGVSPVDIQSEQDLVRLPLLTREDIVQNFDDLVARNIDRRKLVLGHTSGTTGSPLEVLYDEKTVQLTYALLDRQYEWAAVTLARSGDPIAVLRGNVIVPLTQQRPPFWRVNRYHNQILLSAFHMRSENLDAYLDAIRSFEAVVIDGYPSTLYVLARHVLETRRSFPLHAVITGSETLYEFQREAIEEAFQCRVFDYLAAAERVVFSAECDRHEGHHLCSEYGVTEFLNQNGSRVAAGEPGTMVCTTLVNEGMPLIRYVSNDVSAMKSRACSCGRGLPLMEDVTTKAEDMIKLADGRLISPSVLTHPFKPMHNVSASQIIQHDLSDIEIKLVPKADFSDADTNHLQREFEHRLGEGIDIRITLVSELERTSSGKFKWVVSKVADAVHAPTV